MTHDGAPRHDAEGVARASSDDAPRAVTSPVRSGSTRVVGAVLCGGQSRRMGTDKALLTDARGRTLLERATRELERVTDTVLLATGDAARYADHLRPGRSVVLDGRGGLGGGDASSGGGPLAGLCAALAAAGDATLVVAPVDMPAVDAALLEALLARLGAEGADLCLARGPRGIEPLLGAFGPRCAAVARGLLAAGERRPVSLADPAHGLRACFVELTEEESARSLDNVNTPEQWRALREASGSGTRGAGGCGNGTREPGPVDRRLA